MGPEVRRLVIALAGLAAVVAVGLVAAALGWTSSLWWVAALGLVAALWLWSLNVSYRDWIGGQQQDWDRDEWLVRHTAFAAGGILVELVGAALLNRASDANHRPFAALGVLLVLVGLVPVVQVVRVRLSRITDRAVPVSVAWSLNFVMIAVASVVPALTIANNARGLLTGSVVGAIWLLTELADRLLAGRTWTTAIASLLLIGPILLFRYTAMHEGSWLAVLAGALVLGLVTMAARQRHADRTGSMRIEKVIRPDQPFLALGVSLLAIGAGGMWLWSTVEAGTFHRGLLFGGMAVAILFGASLVTRGEGLLIVVAIGIAAVWVVQDNTVSSEDELPGGDSLLVAFGDSYMSGEGTGRFLEGSDTVGAMTYAVGGENEC